MNHEKQFDIEEMPENNQQDKEGSKTREEKLAQGENGLFEMLIQKFVVEEEDFDKNSIDSEGRRKPPSPEEVELMDKNIVKLGKLFDGLGHKWCLDGGFNVSLMNGEYTGKHKDFDMQIKEQDLSEFEEYLKQRNYGFFVSEIEETTDKAKTFKLKRVGHKGFLKALGEKEDDALHLMIGAIDEKGKIRQDESLNLIDVHIFKQDENGAPLGVADNKLPRHWFESEQVEYKGVRINLSHPAKVAYFKLQTDPQSPRKYDYFDVEKLAEIGKLSSGDVQDLGGVFEEEFALMIQQGKEMLMPTLEKISEGMTSQEIFSVFLTNKALQEKIALEPKRGEEIKEFLNNISSDIAEMSEKTPAKIFEIIVDHHDYFRTKRSRIAKLKETAQKAKELKEAREEIGERNNL